MKLVVAAGLVFLAACSIDRMGRSLDRADAGPIDAFGSMPDAVVRLDAPSPVDAPEPVDAPVPSDAPVLPPDTGCPGAAVYFRDTDRDGFGDDATSMRACTSPGAGWVTKPGDCDDASPATFPGAAEICNGRDDDCEPATNDGASDPSIGAACDGSDGDDCTDGRVVCTGVPGCDDSGEENRETCNAVDDDCDGTVDDVACPCPVQRRAGRAYLFCTASDDWDGARGTCRSVGYDLAIMNDRPENDWVWMQASGIAVADWWIGLRRRAPGRYEWVDGSLAWNAGAVGFTRFRSPGSPDGSGDCVEMGADDGGGTWNDVACTQVIRFICEQP